MQSWSSFLAPKLHRVLEFFASQGLAMAGNLFYGFLCVRILPIPEYAKYVTVFASLTTLSILMDISFSSALLPLIGERIDDRTLIADYVASLRQLAHWLYFLLAPAAIVIFPLIVRRQHWGWRVVAAMIAILVVTAWFTRVAGAYGAVLIVRRDRKFWYRVQIISSYGTLALLGISWLLHAINAFSAILINVAGILYVALAYFFRARHLLGVTGKASREKRNAILHLTAPNLPSVIFYAFQGQVSLFIIAYFGHTAAVAGVGALGRLGQMFALASQMTPMLIEPYFARLPREKLKRHYLLLIAAEGGLCCLLSGAARLFPGAFLWILGHKYSGLRYEVFLLMAGSSISYFCGVLWVVNNARRFTYWWYGATVVLVQLSTQIYFICKVDLSTIRAVLTMNICTAAASLAVVLFTGIYGFIFGPRAILEGNKLQPQTDYT